MKQILYRMAGLGLNLWSLPAPRQAVSLAIRLFSTPPRPAIREKERAFLKTARQVRRQLAGLPVVEYHWGEENAPLVVLSYGWGYNAGRWRHFVPELVTAGYRVLAYDPPGHGLAPAGQLNLPLNAAILRTLLEDYGPAEAVIAHSFGGSSTVYALQQLPEYLHPRRVAIMASFSYVPNVFGGYRKALGLWSSLYWRMVRRFEQHIGHPLEHYDFALMAGRLPHVQALIVHAPEDRVTPYGESLRYFSFWPGSLLLSPAEGGHHLGTAGITQEVLDFVLEGKAPALAERQERPVRAEHDLVRFFAGM